MSNATTAAFSSSASSSQSARVLSPVPTVSGKGQYGENITYPNGLKLNPYQLLHLFNSGQYDNQIQAATDQHNRLEPCVKNLFFLRTQQKLFERVIESCSLEIANQVILISQLTSEPLVNEVRLPTIAHSSPKPDNTLIYPDPTPNPNVKPKIECLKPQFHRKVEHIPTVGGEVVPRESEDMVKDEEWENRIPENDDTPPMLSLRSLTLVPILMTKLVDRISALCADWNTISPDIAHSTCVADASKLSLDIHLATVLSNEGLAALRTEGLIQVQMLCRMIAVMMMSPMKISEENAEALVEGYDRDAQLMFVGADPQKVRLLSIEEQAAIGWQPTFDVPVTPMMWTVDEMPDMSYDYNEELYRDGEL
uniref:Reverse transcriptase-rnase h-integrase n=1 Tax=Moniliophthora roreri TaxID=221103 RepID=A0A0W0FYN8_MONRR